MRLTQLMQDESHIPPTDQRKKRRRKQISVEDTNDRLEAEMLQDSYDDEIVPPLPPPLVLPHYTSEPLVSTASQTIILTTSTVSPTMTFTTSTASRTMTSTTSTASRTMTSTTSTASRTMTSTTSTTTSAGNHNYPFCYPPYHPSYPPYSPSYPPYSLSYAESTNTMWRCPPVVTQSNHSSANQSVNHSFFDLYNKIKEIDERVKTIEDRLAELGSASANNQEEDDELRMLMLTREQKITIKMICSNSSIGWKPALRRIMSIVYGQEVLAASCAVGRKNAQFTPLDGRKLDVVKGTYDIIHMHVCICEHLY